MSRSTAQKKKMCPWTDRNKKDDRQLEMFRASQYEPDRREPKWFRLRKAREGAKKSQR